MIKLFNPFFAGVFSLSLILSPGFISLSEAQNKPANTAETGGKPATSTDKLPTRGVNSRTSPRPAPPRTRGGGYPCQIFFRNTTPAFIDLFVNDDFIGTVPPYGNVSVPATAGRFVLFGKAEFDDGSITTWGPQSLSMRTGDTFTWTLRP